MADNPLQRSGSARSNHSLTSRIPSMRLAQSPSPSHSHRQSFTEQMRGLPPSPRAHRHLSLSQAQIQDLVNNPPTAGSADPAFAGRDWQHISVGELVNPGDLHFVELDTGVEAATNVGAYTPTITRSQLLTRITASYRLKLSCSPRSLKFGRSSGYRDLRLPRSDPVPSLRDGPIAPRRRTPSLLPEPCQKGSAGHNHPNS